MAENREDLMDVAAEIREAIKELTAKLKLHRLALTAISKTFAEVVDEGAGSYPGYIRVRNEQ